MNVLEWIWGKTLCLLGFHRPAFSWFNCGKNKDSESICMCCGSYLLNGKVTKDPEVKKRVDEFNLAIARDIMSL